MGIFDKRFVIVCARKVSRGDNGTPVTNVRGDSDKVRGVIEGKALPLALSAIKYLGFSAPSADTLFLSVVNAGCVFSRCDP